MSSHQDDFWRFVELDGGLTSNWVICRNGALIRADGKLASTNTKRRYIYNWIPFSDGKRRICARHRLVATAFCLNPRPDIFIQVDHIDQCTHNNHANNLRWLNNQLNHLNQRSTTCRPRVGFELPYLASITFNGERLWLQDCATAEEAKLINDRTRESLFQALYWWHTRPNTFADPMKEDGWKLRPGCCIVRN